MASIRNLATERKLPLNAGERFRDLNFPPLSQQRAASTVIVLLFEVLLLEATIFGCRASCALQFPIASSK
jgi:hypothetical protein